MRSNNTGSEKLKVKLNVSGVAEKIVHLGNGDIVSIQEIPNVQLEQLQKVDLST